MKSRKNVCILWMKSCILNDFLVFFFGILWIKSITLPQGTMISQGTWAHFSWETMVTQELGSICPRKLRLPKELGLICLREHTPSSV